MHFLILGSDWTKVAVMSSVSELPADKIDDPLAGSISDYRSNSLWRLTLRRLFRQQSALVGGFILIVLILTAIFADFIAP